MNKQQKQIKSCLRYIKLILSSIKTKKQKNHSIFLYIYFNFILFLVWFILDNKWSTATYCISKESYIYSTSAITCSSTPCVCSTKPTTGKLLKCTLFNRICSALEHFRITKCQNICKNPERERDRNKTKFSKLFHYICYLQKQQQQQTTYQHILNSSDNSNSSSASSAASGSTSSAPNGQYILVQRAGVIAGSNHSAPRASSAPPAQNQVSFFVLNRFRSFVMFFFCIQLVNLENSSNLFLFSAGKFNKLI